MGYRWKPNASQRAEYAAKCRERDQSGARGTIHPIREGCKLRFFSLNVGAEIEGIVITSSYGAKTGQHTFLIESADGNRLKVMGRNLYPNIIHHEQGEKSKAESRYK